MNLLSLISFFNSIMFIFSVIYFLKNNVKTQEIKGFILTNTSLAIWTFAYTFFYAADSVESAWFWHKVGMIGASTFPAYSVYYYFQITKEIHKVKNIWRYLIFAILPVFLAIMNIVSPITSCAIGLAKSSSGLGWTYLNSTHSIMFLVYIAYILTYFGIGLFLIFRWGKKATIIILKNQAKVIIYIFGIVLAMGMFSDLILPLFSRDLPPIAATLLVFVLIGDWLIIKKYSFFSVSGSSNANFILKTIMDPVIMVNTNGDIIRINPAATNMFGYSEKEFLNRKINSFFVNNQVISDYLSILIKEKTLKNIETEVISANSKIINIVFSASVAADSNAGILGIVISFHDITERKRILMDLKESKEKYKNLASDYYRLANYDSLTGLPNRRMFFEEIKKRKHFALFFLDLNGFKQVNDYYGHNVGDEILIETSNRLLKCIEEGDVLARMGGDEFVILFIHNVSIEMAENKTALIKNQFINPIIIKSVKHNISVSVGFSIYPDENKSINDVLRDADKGMYTDKKADM